MKQGFHGRGLLRFVGGRYREYLWGQQVIGRGAWGIHIEIIDYYFYGDSLQFDFGNYIFGIFLEALFKTGNGESGNRGIRESGNPGIQN
jgi:hypothetical protein